MVIVLSVSCPCSQAVKVLSKSAGSAETSVEYYIVCSEGDITFRSTGEVYSHCSQADVLEIVVIALTVLSDGPVHLILHC